MSEHFTCPNCYGTVDESTEQCPHCNFSFSDVQPTKKSRKKGYLFFLIILLILSMPVLALLALY